MEIIKLIITVVISSISGLFGYKIHKFLIAFVSFLIGAYLGWAIASIFITNVFLVYIIAAALGLLLGLIGYKLYLLGIFFLCFAAVYVLCSTLIKVENVNIISGIVLGIIVGIMGIKFTKPITILSTSISSAFMVTNALLLFFKLDDLVLLIIISGIMSILASSYQFAHTKKVQALIK